MTGDEFAVKWKESLPRFLASTPSRTLRSLSAAFFRPGSKTPRIEAG